MSDLRLRLPEPKAAEYLEAPPPFGRLLVNAGIIKQDDLVHALNLQQHVDAPLGEILAAEGLARRSDILAALSRQHQMQLADLAADPPDPRIKAYLPTALCLKYQVVPWMMMGDVLLVATNTPGAFADFQACLGVGGRKVLPVLAQAADIRHAISTLYGDELAERAATRVPAAHSCRTWTATSPLRRVWASLIAGAAIGLTIAAPRMVLTGLLLLALLTLVMTTTLKVLAFGAQMHARFFDRTPPAPEAAAPFRLPRVSVLVPLLNEEEIAGKLIERLSRLTYPKSLLDVVLVLEAQDTVTRKTIARTQMPPWMSVIEVPQASDLTTKPRALNYALDFCRGSVIGVWDAEDCPEPDQIERIVTRFNAAPDNVACLQGRLDYYNPRANWLARCFAIEYATWWRMMLPGVARLGLVVPLGGTTLFFRRPILEKLCGWDAHNVTEDADLGLRLAREGYVTELVETTTFEEANARAWPWIKQRSRWLKGYLITWVVHMRAPGKLMKELGFWRFMGVQALFLATFVQFALAPLLWSFWITLLGVTHPVTSVLGSDLMWHIAVVFLVAEVINLTVSLAAVSGRAHRHLLPFVFTMPFYFTMAAVSSYKALKEMVAQPFYWDKTQHGISLGDEPARAAAPDADAAHHADLQPIRLPLAQLWDSTRCLVAGGGRWSGFIPPDQDAVLPTVVPALPEDLVVPPQEPRA
ncbi:glycosyltransferase family 2 protein [Sulfitobacter sp. S190]|uniref:glycosyltransferase family 2 protein n=1 Tax=Sulfitobacter sp. S190 TaxID=2867022 RepID=UPI0021A91ED3|nr:glycosyltransferase family 2 protein [Sulfitobacter sp. S190]UWR21384.1 glycosyltransferase [Sulfitobacter sp. S190]